MARSVTGNRGAFLDMIAASEGTSTVEGSDDGYNVEVGGTLFHDYSNHPHVVEHLKSGNHEILSSAAGRYQLLGRYFDTYKVQLGLLDFSPASQDAIAIQQVRECHSLDAVDKGNIPQAIQLCAHIWASLPGAGYGQRENKIQTLLADYQKAGGSLA